MFNLPANTKIFFCQNPTSMHNSFEGLSVIVESLFHQAPTSGAYFVFLNRKRNLMKVLYWDSDGFALWYKRLEKGTFLMKNNKPNLSRREFFMLLEGIVPKKLNSRYNMP